MGSSSCYNVGPGFVCSLSVPKASELFNVLKVPGAGLTVGR